MNNGVNNQNSNTNSLGNNVKIAPAQAMYDQEGKIIEQKPIVNQQVIQPKPQIEEIKKPNNQQIEEQPKIIEKEKRKISLTPLYLIIIFVLIGYIFYQNQSNKLLLEETNYNKNIIYTDDKEIELDKESTLIKDLYSKVKTTVREDYANNTLNNEMKLYLAYRQIPHEEMYESKCAFFSPNNIYNHQCDELTFTPLGFKGETIQKYLKLLFGENTKIENANIQLSRSCIVGFEYIKSKDEYVQGECTVKSGIDITKTNEIVKATRINNQIIIIEEVKYTSKGEIPEYLKNGYNTYIFELDSNLNYVYVNKEYKTKY